MLFVIYIYMSPYSSEYIFTILQVLGTLGNIISITTLYDIYSYLGIIFFKTFSDISQYCLYDFSYSRQNFIFLSCQYNSLLSITSIYYYIVQHTFLPCHIYIYGLGIHTLGIIISNPMRYGTFSYLGIIYFF